MSSSSSAAVSRQSAASGAAGRAFHAAEHLQGLLLLARFQLGAHDVGDERRVLRHGDEGRPRTRLLRALNLARAAVQQSQQFLLCLFPHLVLPLPRVYPQPYPCPSGSGWYTHL